MSIVERALKKLQHSAEQGTAEAPHRDDVVKPAVARIGDAPGIAVTQTTRSLQPSIEVNLTSLRVHGMLPPEYQERQIVDEFRQIKRPLIANAFGKGVARQASGHLVMMSSALPGEGKTFTSINLALSMASERDISVLLVDADVAKRHVSRLFGLADRPGLLDVLQDDKLDVESLIVPTDIPGLSILPAGNSPTDRATELLASRRMEQTVLGIGEHDPNRIALFDSPPLLLTSESRVLATVVGQVVLVVKAGYTSQQSVLDAISYLGENKSVGVVLNQSEADAPSSYYGYGAYGEGTV